MLNSTYNSSTQDDCQGSHVLVVSPKRRVDTVLYGCCQPFSSELIRHHVPLQQIVILTRRDTTWHLTWLDRASSIVINPCRVCDPCLLQVE